MKLIVRKSHSHARILALLLIVVGLAALLGSVLFPPGIRAFPWVIGLPALFVGAYLPRRCQHPTWYGIFGACTVIGAFLIPVVVRMILIHGISALRNADLLAALGCLTAVCAVLGALSAITWVWVYRLFIARLVLQDGQTCPICAYNVKHVFTDTCPECGQQFSPDELAPGPYVASSGIPMKVAVPTLLALLLTILAWRFFSVHRVVPLSVIGKSEYWGYRIFESKIARGEEFYDLVLSLNEDAVYRGKRMTPEDFRAIVGFPDLFLADDTGTYYVYYFAGGSQVAYVTFSQGQLTNLGFNAPGVNNHSGFRPFPPDAGRRVEN
ncbi:MAG: hypothetical protein JSU63_07895 [Phycisphaerales bacterium]|nr:MAG: hypothetical protein JSU63_07895 [Phycisphaerales bacterium]